MSKRDLSIDCLKGFSILLVAVVFLGAYFDFENLFIRLLFSVEMPGFYIAAGFTLGLSASKYSPKHFLARAGWLILFAALLDVMVWRKFPLVYGEPLSIIGLATPVVYFLARRGTKALWICYALSIVLGSALQSLVGYRTVQTNQMWWWQYAQTPIWQQSTNISLDGALRSWFIDGWSPFFPYLAFFLFGALLSGTSLRGRNSQGQTQWKVVLLSVGLLILSGLVWILFPGTNIKRFGYLEMSYPPVPGYVLFTCAFGFLFIALMDVLSIKRLKHGLQFFGKAPLACFFVVNIMMRYAIYPSYTTQLPLTMTLILYLETVLVMAAVIFVFSRWRKQLRAHSLPEPVKMLLGGA